MSLSSRSAVAPPVPDVSALAADPVLGGRARELWTTVKFLSVNGSIAVGGYLLLRALVDRGVPVGAANAVQAMVTLQINFLAGLLFTWRWRTAGSWVGVGWRWLRFQMGRGTVLLINLALFPLLAPRLGIPVTFVGLLVICALAHYALDRWWVFRLDRERVAI